MEATGSQNIELFIQIKKSEIDFVTDLLEALKKRGMIEFHIDREQTISNPLSQ